MFQLSKIIGAFVTFPGLVVTLFLILALVFLIRRKKEWKLFLLFSTLFYMFSSSWFVYIVSKTLFVQNTRDAGLYIVVLGGGVDQFGDQTEIGAHTLRRLYKGIQLYRHNKRKIVVTGGVISKGVSEAIVMKDVLVTFGIPEEDIIVEERARNTDENAKYVKELLGDIPVTIVTSSLHMKRSILSFNKRFSKVYNVQCDVPIDFRNSYLDYLPSSGAFYTFCNVTHEIVGLLKYSF
ncbi:MAG: YdcF family protein [Fervidobacterium sp.]